MIAKQESRLLPFKRSSRSAGLFATWPPGKDGFAPQGNIEYGIVYHIPVQKTKVDEPDGTRKTSGCSSPASTAKRMASCISAEYATTRAPSADTATQAPGGTPSRSLAKSITIGAIAAISLLNSVDDTSGMFSLTIVPYIGQNRTLTLLRAVPSY